MNSIRIPNLSDENSILITAEFFEDGHRLRLDRTRVHRYELDLIVPDDITLDELLDAIHAGIRTQLAERYHLDDPKTDPAYLETVRRFEEFQNRYASLSREFFRKRPRRRPLHFRHHAAISAAERYNAACAPEEPAPAEEDLWRWLVCLNVFQVCQKQYRQGYPEAAGSNMRVAFRQKAYPKHPVIACGSIFSRNWRDETLRFLARHTQIWLRQQEHGGKTLRELGFVSSSRLIFEPNSHHSATPWFDALELQVPGEDQFPQYNTGERREVQTVSSKIRIDSPQSLRHTPVPTIFFACGALLVAAATFLPGAFLIQQMNFLASSFSDALLYCWILIALTAGWCGYRKLCIMQQRQWYRHYEDYIRDILGRLKTIQREDVQFLSRQYPPVYDLENSNDLLERTFRLDGSISGRRRDQRDFLHVRIGLSKEGSCTVRSLAEFQFPEHNEQFSAIRYKNIRGISALPFQIIAPGESEEALRDNDGTVGFLNCLAEDIQDAYAWLDRAPVLMDLHHPRAMGVCFQDTACSFYPLMNNMIFDLCYHHSPEDLQFVMFCPKISGLRRRQEFIRQFKQLPHFNGLLRDQSQFVFDGQYASHVMDRLRQLHAPDRSDRKGPHVVMVMLEDHGFRRHPLSGLLPSCAGEMEPAGNNLTFLFFSHTETALPPYCSHVLRLDSSRNCCYLPYVYRFEPGARRIDPSMDDCYGIILDSLPGCFLTPGKAAEHDRMFQGFKILSALRQQGTNQSSLPRHLDLRQLLRQVHPEKADPLDADFVREQWRLGQRRSDMRFPIGTDIRGSTWLDLEKLGHVLVASDTGVGRSESMGAMLQSLCCHYGPQSAQIFLADPRPEGLPKHLGGQPQIALTLSEGPSVDFAGALEKLCGNLRKEANRRAAEFELLKVSDLRSYNRALRKHEGQENAGLAAVKSTIPRLILAADHLEGYANDVIIQELGWLLEHGVDYGIHIILSSGNPGSFLPPELWNHFRGRLCLKTRNASLSEWMVHSDSACDPAMPCAGRCYQYDTLTGELVYTQLVQLPGTVPIQITWMEPNRRSLLFYSSVDSANGASVPPYIPPKTGKVFRRSTTKNTSGKQTRFRAAQTEPKRNEDRSHDAAVRFGERLHEQQIQADIPDDQIIQTEKSILEIPDDRIRSALRRI